MMDLDLEDLLKNSFFITVDDERAREFATIFTSAIGICPRRLDGFSDGDLCNSRRCELGHISIIRMAKALRLPHVTIFEDDAYPMEDAINRMERLLKDIPEDAKAAIWGYSRCFGSVDANGGMRRLTANVWGSHAYTVFSSGFDEYIKAYDANPLRTSDGFFDQFGPIYISNEKIFIQRCRKRSMNGFVGYIWDAKSNPSPPPGFLREEHYLGIGLDEDAIRSMASSLIENMSSENCLIIGSGPSISGCGLGGYVDSFNGDVIRVNRLPMSKYKRDYGSRTDILFTCKWYDDFVARQDFDKKVIVDDGQISSISKKFSLPDGKWLTTGMICIIMSMCSYGRAFLMGFGSGPCGSDEMYQSIHEIKNLNVVPGEHHDISYEHDMIDALIKTNYRGRLSIIDI